MKTLQLSLLTFVLFFLAQASFAQAKSEKFIVSGNCGMCKSKIETAAKNAGATYAVWNEESKELAVKYKAGVNAEKIQKSIAAAGYDTPGIKATDEAYNKLHSCCKYERTSTTNSSCCDGANCSKEECKNCCKDGKCTDPTMACCKDGQCKDAQGHAGAKEGTASCCKKTSN